MKSTGIVRKLDELGRITLPIELRRNLDVNERDPLEIFVDDDQIILKKYNPSDIFTGEMENLIEYKGKFLKIPSENWQDLPDSRFLNNHIMYSCLHTNFSFWSCCKVDE